MRNMESYCILVPKHMFIKITNIEKKLSVAKDKAQNTCIGRKYTVVTEK